MVIFFQISCPTRNEREMSFFEFEMSATGHVRDSLLQAFYVPEITRLSSLDYDNGLDKADLLT